MKSSLQTALMLAFSLLLNSCLYDEPVFKEDVAGINESLTGVWVAHEKEGDPRTSEYAVLVPFDEDHYLLHHPARSSDSLYYEAAPVKRRNRTLLQLRILATFRGGPPKPTSKRFTILWIQPQGDNQLLVRAPDGQGILTSMTPEETRRILEDPSSDWENLFDEGRLYRRLKDSD